VLRILHTLGWLLCAAYSTIPGYWLLIHPRVNYWRAQQRSPYRVILPVWGVMVAAVLGITERFRALTLYQSGWAWLPAVVLFAVGIWLYKMGGANFSLKQLQGQPEISAQNEEQRLVTTGIRARVRHPVYLAHLCEMLAWSIGTGLVVCYGLTALTIFTGAFMIRAEDAELEQRFGEDYRRYRNTVPAVVPKLGNTVSRL
jgi:protein-S-isoprenylcysteine O-methyltransferase Ste14